LVTCAPRRRTLRKKCAKRRDCPTLRVLVGVLFAVLWAAVVWPLVFRDCKSSHIAPPRRRFLLKSNAHQQRLFPRAESNVSLHSIHSGTSAGPRSVVLCVVGGSFVLVGNPLLPRNASLHSVGAAVVDPFTGPHTPTAAHPPYSLFSATGPPPLFERQMEPALVTSTCPFCDRRSLCVHALRGIASTRTGTCQRGSVRSGIFLLLFGFPTGRATHISSFWAGQSGPCCSSPASRLFTFCPRRKSQEWPLPPAHSIELHAPSVVRHALAGFLRAATYTQREDCLCVCPLRKILCLCVVLQCLFDKVHYRDHTATRKSSPLRLLQKRKLFPGCIRTHEAELQTKTTKNATRMSFGTFSFFSAVKTSLRLLARSVDL